MTLKQFAEQQGISYNLAKQWKARGKIVTEGDGYRLATPGTVTDGCNPEAVTVTEGASVTVGSVTGVTGGNFTIAELCAMRAQIEELQQQIGETRAFLIDSNNIVLQFQADNAVLQDRMVALETDVHRLHLNSRKSNYTGPAKSIGESYDDLPYGYESDFPQ